MQNNDVDRKMKKETRPRMVYPKEHSAALEKIHYLQSENKKLKAELKRVKIILTEEKKSSCIKVAISTFLISAVIAGSAIGIIKHNESSAQNDIIQTQIEDFYEIVKDNTTAMHDPDGNTTYKHTEKQINRIALELMRDPDNFDINLYAVYVNFREHYYNEACAIGTLDDIYKAYNHLAPSNGVDERENESFHDFCKANHFTDENGNISISKYTNAMDHQIIVQNNIEKYSEERLNRKM